MNKIDLDRAVATFLGSLLSTKFSMADVIRHVFRDYRVTSRENPQLARQLSPILRALGCQLLKGKRSKVLDDDGNKSGCSLWEYHAVSRAA